MIQHLKNLIYQSSAQSKVLVHLKKISFRQYLVFLFITKSDMMKSISFSFAKLTNNGLKWIEEKSQDPTKPEKYSTPFFQINLKGSTDMLSLEVRDFFQRCGQLSKEEKIKQINYFIKQKCRILFETKDPKQRLVEITNIDGLITEAIATKDNDFIKEIIEGPIFKTLFKVIDGNDDKSIYVGFNCMNMLFYLSDFENPSYFHLLPSTVVKIMQIVQKKVFFMGIHELNKQIFRLCITTIRMILEYTPFQQSRQLSEEEVAYINTWIIELDTMHEYLPPDTLDAIVFYFYDYISKKGSRLACLTKDEDKFIDCLTMLTHHKKHFFGLVAMMFPMDDTNSNFFKHFLDFFKNILGNDIDQFDPDELYDEDYPYISLKEQTITCLGVWAAVNKEAPRWILENEGLVRTLLFTYHRQSDDIKSGFLAVLSKIIEVAVWIKRKDPLVKPLKEVNLGKFLVNEMGHEDKNIRLYASACLIFPFIEPDKPRPANNRYYKTYMAQLRSAGNLIQIYTTATESLQNMGVCHCSKPNCPYFHPRWEIAE